MSLSAAAELCFSGAEDDDTIAVCKTCFNTTNLVSRIVRFESGEKIQSTGQRSQVTGTVAALY